MSNGNSSSAKAARVVIVDDDPLARETLSALLRREGYTLLFANSGQDAIARLPELAPDLLLLDVMMPGMDGFMACRTLKAMPACRHVPIILVTALDDRSDLVRGLEAGADEFISKPVNSLELKARVRTMLRIKQQYDALQSALRTRDLLSSMIIHDMRNPLAAVQLYTQLLKRSPNLGTEQAKYLDLIFNETHQVSTFLEDIQLLAKLEEAQVTLARSPINVARLLTEVQQKLLPLLQAQRIELVVEQPLQPAGRILADLYLFQRVLDSLLTQAIKAAPAQTQLTITVTYPRHTTNDPTARQLRLHIRHAGAPIPPEDLAHIFDQDAIMTHKHLKPLVGLGLAYSRMVVEAHGGVIFAENLEPEGVAFVVEL